MTEDEPDVREVRELPGTEAEHTLWSTFDWDPNLHNLLILKFILSGTVIAQVDTDYSEIADKVVSFKESSPGQFA